MLVAADVARLEPLSYFGGYRQLSMSKSLEHLGKEAQTLLSQNFPAVGRDVGLDTLLLFLKVLCSQSLP